MKDIIQKHLTWFYSMGYRKSTPLEQLALIISEIGESVNECRREQCTEQLGRELADIILRVITLADMQGIDIEAALYAKIEENNARGNKGRKV